MVKTCMGCIGGCILCSVLEVREKHSLDTIFGIFGGVFWKSSKWTLEVVFGGFGKVRKHRSDSVVWVPIE
jgi:hypothetical protein